MMKMRTLWQTMAIVSFTLLFVLTRIGTAEHSARFGSGPHQHDGKLCALSLVANDDDENVVLPTDVPPTTALITRYQTPFSYAVLAAPALGETPRIPASARSPPTV